MRPIYRALQKLTPPRNTPPPQVPASIHSSPSSRLMNGVLFSVGFLDSQLSSHRLLYASSNWLLIPRSDCEWLYRGSTFATPVCENTKKKDNSGISSDSLCDFAMSFELDQRKHLQRWTHTIVAIFSSWRSYCMTSVIFITISWQLYSHQPWLCTYIHWLANANSLVGRPQSQVKKMTWFLFTFHVSLEWPLCVSWWRAASM